MLNAATYYPEKPLNWFERVILRAQFRYGRWDYRTSWGQLVFRLGFALTYSCYEHPTLHIHLLWPSFFIRLRRPWFKERPEDLGQMPSWGVSWFEGTLHFKWRAACKIVHMTPWRNWQFYRETVWDSEGAPITVYSNSSNRWERIKDKAHKEEHPFRYVNPCGRIDEVTATVSGGESEYRLKYLTWLPFIRRIHRSIDVSFSDEVGKGKGSWKGGCVGCGWEWKRNQTLREALMDMQHNRRNL